MVLSPNTSISKDKYACVVMLFRRLMWTTISMILISNNSVHLFAEIKCLVRSSLTPGPMVQQPSNLRQRLLGWWSQYAIVRTTSP
mmetsp:Transcript_14499/g.27852  ORF Transcript_14499/g.27852 Transcript_14499/m.27852 type:complete len:85 (-) Transcript_14499:988-1242(-)